MDENSLYKRQIDYKVLLEITLIYAWKENASSIT